MHDHLDGTFSVLPQDPESTYDPNRQPYVASQGHTLQSPSPSASQPSHSVPFQSGTGKVGTPALSADNYDKSTPQAGKQTPANSGEANSNESNDTLPTVSQDPGPKKREANNNEISIEPKRVKTTSVLEEKDPEDEQLHTLPENRTSSSLKHAFWEGKWGSLPYAENEPGGDRRKLHHMNIIGWYTNARLI